MLNHDYDYVYVVEIENDYVDRTYIRGYTADVANSILRMHIAQYKTTPSLYTGCLCIVYKLPKKNIYRYDTVCEMMPTRPCGYLIVTLTS